MENRHEDRLTENFQMMIDEAHTDNHSQRWKMAVTDLKAIHKDLPDVATLAARSLPIADNPMLAQRLANTSIREVSAIGREEMDDQSMTLAIRRTHRSVLMQEAAGQMIHEKEGVRNASDFMGLKQTLSPEITPGKVAIAALQKQGIDARRMFREMSDKEMRSVSVGAYDRVNSENRDRITGALETTGHEQRKEQVKEQDAGYPVMRARRNQFAVPPRQPTFGRKMAAVHHQQQPSMAL